MIFVRMSLVFSFGRGAEAKRYGAILELVGPAGSASDPFYHSSSTTRDADQRDAKAADMLLGRRGFRVGSLGACGKRFHAVAPTFLYEGCEKNSYSEDFVTNLENCSVFSTAMLKSATGLRVGTMEVKRSIVWCWLSDVEVLLHGVLSARCRR